MIKRSLLGFSSLLFALILTITGTSEVLAGTGDFSPSRNAVAITDNTPGSSTIEFNRFTRSAPLCFFSGHCPNPVTVCRERFDRASCKQSEFESGLFGDEITKFVQNSDERDFFKAGEFNGTSGAPYKNTLTTNLQEGDEIRTMIYMHNNAPECNDEQPGQRFNACVAKYTAKNTSVTVNWADIESLKAEISASNATPYNPVRDIASLNFAAGDFTLEPIRTPFFLFQKTGATRTPITASSSTSYSATYDFGDFRSSFGNFKILYVDFKVVRAQPSATIVKSSDPVTTSVVPRGSEIDYTLTIKNTGNITLTNASVSDVLDTNLTFISAEESNKYTSSFSNGVVTFNINEDEFTPGKEIDLTFTVRVNEDTPLDAEIFNEGTLQTNELNDLVSNETVHTVQEGDVEVTKEAFADFNDTALSPVRVGSTYAYKVTITNNEDFPAYGVITAEDILPAELDFVSFDPANNANATATEANDTLTYSFGTAGTSTLNPGESETFRFTVKVVALPPAKNTTTTAENKVCENGILNTVTINGREVSDDEDCVPVPVLRLASTKKAFLSDYSAEITSVQVGQTFGYEIAITNNSGLDFDADFLVKDRFPSELDFVDFVDAVSDSGTDYNVVSTRVTADDTEQNKTVMFTWSDLEDNDTIRLRFLVKARVIPTNGQTVGSCPDPTKYNNRAWVFAYRSGQTQNNANELYQRDLCHPLVVTDDVEPTITKQAFLDYAETPITEAFNLNDEFVYKIVVSNETDSNLNGVVRWTDTLPVELDYVSPQASNDPQIVENNDFLTAEFGTEGTLTLEPGEERVFRFTVKIIARPNGEVTTTTDTEFDPDTCRVTTTTTNANNQIVNQVQLFHNDVEVTSRIDDDCVNVPVLTKPTSTKKAFLSDYSQEITSVEIDQTFGYEIAVTNPNNIDYVADFLVKDRFPSELDFVEFVDAVSDSGTNYNVTATRVTADDREKYKAVMFTWSDLEANDTIRLRFLVKARVIPTNGQTVGGCPDPTKYNNRAWVFAYKSGQTQNNANELYQQDLCHPLVVTEPQNPSYTMDKKALDLQNVEIPDNTTLQFGQEFKYQIVVTNTSNVNLTGLVVTDDLPPEVNFVSLEDPTDGNYDQATNILTYNAGDLDIGETKTFTFRVDVKSADEIASQDNIINNATADVNELPEINDNTIHQLPKENTGCDPATENCGGGSVPVNPSAGKCHINPNGSPSCIKTRPIAGSFGVAQSPGYDLYVACLIDGQPDANLSSRQAIIDGAPNALKEDCVNYWAETLGYNSCNPSGSTADLERDCTQPIICPNGNCGGGPGTPPTSCNVGASTSIDKSVWHDKTSAWENETCVKAGDIATYKISVEVFCPNININNAEVRVGDAIIPFTSGWTWDSTAGISNIQRINGPTNQKPISSNQDIDLGTTGVLTITQGLTASEISQCKGGGLTLEYTYDVDTTLATSADVCQLDSVAYAFVEVNGTEGLANTPVTHHGDSRGGSDCSFDSGDLATIGSSQTRVCIARPFIKARGGSNIGVNISTDKEKVFGSDFQSQLSQSTSTKPLVPSLDAILTNTTDSTPILVNGGAGNQYGGQLVDFGEIKTFASASDRTKFFNQLALNAQNAPFPFGGNEQKSQASEMFFTGDLVIDESLPVTINEGVTIVVDGNLTIKKDFINNGNGFVAFVVRKTSPTNGNITIEKGVERLDGIFLADGGEILSNGPSEVQLEINGGLMGDAENLLNNRLFIGTDPVNELEPAILVRFNLKLLESTPPGLEIFLGDGWRESLQ